MRRSRFTEEQTINLLKGVGAGQSAGVALARRSSECRRKRRPGPASGLRWTPCATRWPTGGRSAR